MDKIQNHEEMWRICTWVTGKIIAIELLCRKNYGISMKSNYLIPVGRKNGLSTNVKGAVRILARVANASTMRAAFIDHWAVGNIRHSRVCGFCRWGRVQLETFRARRHDRVRAFVGKSFANHFTRRTARIVCIIQFVLKGSTSQSPALRMGSMTCGIVGIAWNKFYKYSFCAVFHTTATYTSPK